MTDRQQGRGAGIAIALVLVATLAVLQVAAGGLFITTYSADSLFVLDALSRITAGQVPHVDFTLHLGALPFAGLALFSGGSVLRGILLGQITFTLALLAVTWWIGRTRLGRGASTGLFCAIAVIGMSVVDEVTGQVTLALFYNRWAWAEALLFVCLCCVGRPPDRWRRLDGGIVGALAFALLVTKITFFVALVPIAFLAYLVARRWTEIVTAAATFLALTGAVALTLGPGFWTGYIDNLAWVAGNPLRPYAGVPLAEMLSQPGNAGYWACYAAFLVVTLRFQGAAAAFWHAALAAGFLYIQYQNFGNSPVWILVVALFCAVALGRTDKARDWVQRLGWRLIGTVAAILTAVLFFPMLKGSVVNLALSQGPAFVPLVPGVERYAGLSVRPGEVAPIQVVFHDTASGTERDGPGKGAACSVQNGDTGILHALAHDLARLPGPAYVADGLSPYWFLAGMAPLTGAAPWNYGSLRGLDNAAFVVLPHCPVKPNYQVVILEALAHSGVDLHPYREVPWATIHAIGTAR